MQHNYDRSLSDPVSTLPVKPDSNIKVDIVQRMAMDRVSVNLIQQHEDLPKDACFKFPNFSGKDDEKNLTDYIINCARESGTELRIARRNADRSP